MRGEPRPAGAPKQASKLRTFWMSRADTCRGEGRRRAGGVSSPAQTVPNTTRLCLTWHGLAACCCGSTGTARQPEPLRSGCRMCCMAAHVQGREGDRLTGVRGTSTPSRGLHLGDGSTEACLRALLRCAGGQRLLSCASTVPSHVSAKSSNRICTWPCRCASGTWTCRCYIRPSWSRIDARTGSEKTACEHSWWARLPPSCTHWAPQYHDLTHKLAGSEEHMANAALRSAGGRTCTRGQHGRSRSLGSAWHGGTLARDAAE